MCVSVVLCLYFCICLCFITSYLVSSRLITTPLHTASPRSTPLCSITLSALLHTAISSPLLYSTPLHFTTPLRLLLSEASLIINTYGSSFAVEASQRRLVRFVCMYVCMYVCFVITLQTLQKHSANTLQTLCKH